jgi:hypothetical protein
LKSAGSLVVGAAEVLRGLFGVRLLGVGSDLLLHLVAETLASVAVSILSHFCLCIGRGDVAEEIELRFGRRAESIPEVRHVDVG